MRNRWVYKQNIITTSKNSRHLQYPDRQRETLQKSIVNAIKLIKVFISCNGWKESASITTTTYLRMSTYAKNKIKKILFAPSKHYNSQINQHREVLEKAHRKSSNEIMSKMSAIANGLKRVKIPEREHKPYRLENQTLNACKIIDDKLTSKQQ